MDQSDTNLRIIEQLHSLLRPHAAGAHALLDRWERGDPFKAATDEAVAPLLKSLSELPVGELAALLEAAIEADKGGRAAPDPNWAMELLSKLEADGRSALEEIQAFEKRRVPLPAALSSELHQAVKVEAARLERDLAVARARTVTKHDLQILREAEVPRERIDAIVRDAPTQDDIDYLTARLAELRQVLASSADGARLDESLEPLEAFTTAAGEVLHPILDPMVMQQLRDLARPIIEADTRGSQRG